MHRTANDTRRRRRRAPLTLPTAPDVCAPSFGRGSEISVSNLQHIPALPECDEGDVRSRIALDRKRA